MCTACAAIDHAANRRWLFHTSKICLPPGFLLPSMIRPNGRVASISEPGCAVACRSRGGRSMARVSLLLLRFSGGVRSPFVTLRLLDLYRGDDLMTRTITGVVALAGAIGLALGWLASAPPKQAAPAILMKS